MKKVLRGVTFIVLLGSWALGTAIAAAEEPYYKGKSIRIIVTSGAGGLADFHGRVGARFLPKYIPGNPTVIVQNMPGGGSDIGSNYVYNVAKPDGRTILQPSTGMPLRALLGFPGVRYDPTKMIWLGALSKSEYILVLLSEKPFNTVKDLQDAKKPVFLGAMPGTGVFTITRLLMEVLKIPVKIIRYKSGTEVDAAMARKEVDGRVNNIPTYLTRNKDWLDSKFTREFVQIRESRHPAFPNTPTLYELAPDRKDIIELANAQNTWMASWGLRPGVPEDRVQVLRTAYNKMVNDPKFIKMLKTAANMDPTPGDELTNKIKKVAATPPEQVKLLKDLWGLK